MGLLFLKKADCDPWWKRPGLGTGAGWETGFGAMTVGLLGKEERSEIGHMTSGLCG